jgi:hypothetical protein
LIRSFNFATKNSIHENHLQSPKTETGNTQNSYYSLTFPSLPPSSFPPQPPINPISISSPPDHVTISLSIPLPFPSPLNTNYLILYCTSYNVPSIHPPHPNPIPHLPSFFPTLPSQPITSQSSPKRRGWSPISISISLQAFSPRWNATAECCA